MAKASLPDGALVCRGGSCLARRFAVGSGVTIDGSGLLRGVSVNAAASVALKDLAKSIPNRMVGVSTAGAIRAAGGMVAPAPNSRNSFYFVMSGITAEQAEALFTPTIRTQT